MNYEDKKNPLLILSELSPHHYYGSWVHPTRHYEILVDCDYKNNIFTMKYNNISYSKYGSKFTFKEGPILINNLRKHFNVLLIEADGVQHYGNRY